jgi:hypothetical protein
LLKAAVVGGIVAGLTAAAVLLACAFVLYLVTVRAPVRVDHAHGVVIEGSPGGPTTTFTVSQLPTP